MEFNITNHPQCYLLEISGRIDSYTAPKIEEVLNNLIKENQVNIVIDLEKTTYISSSGILLFVKAQGWFTNLGIGKIIFCNVPKLIYSSFSLSGFHELFTFYKNPTLAMESL
jgi:anti-anti-sigma factor